MKKEPAPLRILHLLEDIAIILPLVVVLVLALVNVLLRYVFLTGILWSEELMGFCMLMMGTIGAAACVRDRLHTSLDNIVNKFSLKVQKIFYFYVNTLVIIMLAVFTYGGIMFTKSVGSQMTFILNWPMKIFYGMIPLGCFLCLVEQIINVVSDIKHGNCRFKTIEEMIAEEEAAADSEL